MYLGSHIYLRTYNIPIFRMTWLHMDPMPYVFPDMAFYSPVRIIWLSVFGTYLKFQV